MNRMDKVFVLIACLVCVVGICAFIRKEIRQNREWSEFRKLPGSPPGQIIVTRDTGNLRFRLYYENGDPVMGDDRIDDPRGKHLDGFVAKFCFDCMVPKAAK